MTGRGSPDESILLAGVLAIPGIALLVLGLRRRNPLLVAAGAFTLGRAPGTCRESFQPLT